MSCRRSTTLRRQPTPRRRDVSRLKQPARRGGSARHGPVACRGLRTSPLWAEKVTEGVRAPHSGEPKRKRRQSGGRRGSHGREEGDGDTTGDAQGQRTTAPLGETATADVEKDGGARDAARAAEKVMISEAERTA